jgi:hypothetical protein
VGRGLEGVDVGAGLGAAQGGQPGLLGRGDRASLVAREVQDAGRRADEGDAVGGALLGEVGVLAEEAVAGVDRVGAGVDRGAHHRRRVEVGAHGVPLLADLVGLVGLEDVLGLAVLVREDGDGLGAELGGGSERADGDLAAVGDEDLAEHRGPPVGWASGPSRS